MDARLRSWLDEAAEEALEVSVNYLAQSPGGLGVSLAWPDSEFSADKLSWNR